MGFFKDIAVPLVARGVPVIPLLPKSKIAFRKDWPDQATTDLVQVEAWDKQYPDANAASVAKATPTGFWFLELDRPEAGQRIEEETGVRVPDTFRVRSRPGRGHLYWRQSPASLAMGNIAQGFVKYGDWSARVDNQYVVSPGSIHPDSGLPYIPLNDRPIIEAPDWLIKYLIGQKLDKKTVSKTVEEGAPIAAGARNSTLASLAGKARQVMKMDEYQILNYLLDVNSKQCQPPLDDAEVRTIAVSIARYPVKEEAQILVRGVPLEVAAAQKPDEPEPVVIPKVPYPVFPHWVMNGTSIYEGFVKPVCDVNSRYPEFMWLPAMVVLMNYLGNKIKVAGKMDKLPLSFFMISIGKRGAIIKSSSVQDAFQYFENIGFCGHSNSATRNAEGKSMIFSPGSPEGLGLEMQRTQCKNVVLFYDEFMQLVNKAGIDTSSLVATLLSIYESGKFSNTIKAKKESYSIDPGSYTASLIACTTDKNFVQLWGRLMGNETSGLKDRFFFLFQPKILKARTPYVYVSTGEGAMKTRKLVDKAVAKGTYAFSTDLPLNEIATRMENRQEQRVEKLALALAVDLDRDEIDEDCIERAIAVIEYEKAVKRYFRTYETRTREAEIQMSIQSHLMQHDGVAPIRDVDRELHGSETWGAFLWVQAAKNLVMVGKMAEEGSGKKGEPTRWRSIWAPDASDE